MRVPQRSLKDYGVLIKMRFASVVLGMLWSWNANTILGMRRALKFTRTLGTAAAMTACLSKVFTRRLPHFLVVNKNSAGRMSSTGCDTRFTVPCRIPVTVIKPLVVETSSAAAGGGGAGQGECMARLGAQKFSPGTLFF